MQASTRNTLFIGLLIFVALAATGFIWLYNSKSAQKQVLPSIKEIREFTVVLRYDTANVRADIGVENPLPFDITIDSLSYTVLHNSDTLGKGTNTPDNSLQARRTTFLPLHIGVNFGEMEQKIAQMQDQDSTNIDMQVRLFFTLPVVGQQSINIEQSKPVSVPKLPVYKVTSTKVTDFGLGEGVEMELTMEVNNNNLEDLYISNVVYHVQVEDFIDATEKPGKTYVIKSGTKSSHKVPLHLGIREAAKAKIKQKFGDKTWNVTVSGTADVRSDNPMMQHVQLKFSKTDVVDASKTGKPVFLGNYPVQEHQPRNIAFSPNGRWLLVTGEKSPVVGSYAIGVHGSLNRVSEAPSGKGTLWIEMWQPHP
ncbi:MAG: hypothetical protein EOO68_29460 [Moraxellaceae bacterium]|nr:MAG: hypothetical protein EOO68_29460 [Moraxellaceae bacterium]